MGPVTHARFFIREGKAPREGICGFVPFDPDVDYPIIDRAVVVQLNPDSRDAVLGEVLMTVWVKNYSVYGAHKLWKSLHRAGETVGRDQVARIMRGLGIQGARRGGKVFTTRPMTKLPAHRTWWTASSQQLARTRCGSLT